MRNRFAVGTAVAFAVATMITIPYSGFILTVAAAQQQQMNSTIPSSQNTNSSPAPPLPLKTIFKQVQNSVVQITSKIPTTTTTKPNPQNPQTPNATTLGSGYVYDKQGHIVTNNHVVGDAKIVDVTFPDGNRYTANVLAKDIDNDIAVVQISKPQQLLSSFKSLALGNSSKGCWRCSNRCR